MSKLCMGKHNCAPSAQSTHAHVHANAQAAQREAGLRSTATDEELAFIPAAIEGAPSYRSRSGAHVGRLRGMVFVGAPVGDDDWVAEELELKFRELVRRLPALARMRAFVHWYAPCEFAPRVVVLMYECP